MGQLVKDIDLTLLRRPLQAEVWPPGFELIFWPQELCPNSLAGLENALQMYLVESPVSCPRPLRCWSEIIRVMILPLLGGFPHTTRGPYFILVVTESWQEYMERDKITGGRLETSCARKCSAWQEAPILQPFLLWHQPAQTAGPKTQMFTSQRSTDTEVSLVGSFKFQH